MRLGDATASMHFVLVLPWCVCLKTWNIVAFKRTPNRKHHREGPSFEKHPGRQFETNWTNVILPQVGSCLRQSHALCSGIQVAAEAAPMDAMAAEAAPTDAVAAKAAATDAAAAEAAPDAAKDPDAFQ